MCIYCSYDVYIFGGFQDTKGYSIKLAKELFRKYTFAR